MTVIFNGEVTIEKMVTIGDNATIETLSLDNSQQSTHPTQVNALVLEDQKRVADQLMPFFFMKRHKVEEFLALATGAEPKNITKMVNHYVASNEINRALHKGDMFEILKEHNIYPASKSTWNDQVNFS